MRTIDGGLVALGVTLMGTSGAFTWKVASMKAEVVSEYKTRVALAQAGLDEHASASLRQPARRVNQVLGDLDRFDPNEALGDPAELRGFVDRVSRVLDARRALPGYFLQMLNTGPRLLLLLGVLNLGLPVTFSYYSGLHRVRLVGAVGVVVCVVVAIVACYVSVRHFLTLHRFASAEVSAMSDDG
jgi:hypothetical protein